METLNPWDELFRSLGRSVQSIGTMLMDTGRHKESLQSVEQLTNLRDDLTAAAATIDKRIDSLKEGNQ